MASLRVDVAGVDSGGSRVGASGAPPKPLTALAAPLAADPVSVAVAATRGARAAAVHAHSTLAAALTRGRGAQLRGDTTGYLPGGLITAVAPGPASGSQPSDHAVARR